MATGAKAHVGVVTGDPLRSLGLVAILEEIQGVTAAAVSLDEAVADTFTSLMVDLRGSLEAVIQSIKRLRKAKPEAKLIVMSETLSPEDVQAVIGAGAKGYLAETARVNEIVMAIEVVLDGSIWAPRKVLANLIASGGGDGTGARGRGNEPIEQMLTEREMDVLQLLMNGRSNREIAAAMGVESATVKAHIGRMLRKTKATNRVELTLRAMEEKEQKTAVQRMPDVSKQ